MDGRKEPPCSCCAAGACTLPLRVGIGLDHLGRLGPFDLKRIQADLPWSDEVPISELNSVCYVAQLAFRPYIFLAYRHSVDQIGQMRSESLKFCRLRVELGRTGAEARRTRSRSNAVNKHSQFGPESTGSGQIQLRSARKRPNLPRMRNFGQSGPDFDRNRPNSARNRPRLAPGVGKQWPELGRAWPEVGRDWLRIGRHFPETGQVWLDSTTPFGRAPADVDQTWPGIGRSSAKFGPPWPKLD